MDFRETLTKILLCDRVAEKFTKEYRSNGAFRAWIDDLIPEVSACYRQEQRGVWHIYNVMEHILHSVEEMNRLTADLPESERRLLAYTMFFHDLGKPAYHQVKRKDGKETDSFRSHHLGSEKAAERILRHLSFDESEKAIILILVREHDVFLKFSDAPQYDWQVKPTREYLHHFIEELNRFGDGSRIFQYLIWVGIADNRAQNPAMTSDALAMLSYLSLEKELTFLSKKKGKPKKSNKTTNK